MTNARECDHQVHSGVRSLTMGLATAWSEKERDAYVACMQAKGYTEPERITKIDAAQRQLCTAIRLFFEERDDISIFALASAAQELLRDLLKTRGQGSVVMDSAMIRPGRKKEFRDAMKRPKNFLKHADWDPDGVLEFRSQSVPFLLLDCVDMHGRYVLKHTHATTLFFMWFSLNYPDLLLPGTELAEHVESFHKESPFTEPRKDLFLEVLNRAPERGDPRPLPLG